MTQDCEAPEFLDAALDPSDIDPATFPAIIAHLRKHDPAAYIAAAARLIGDAD